MSVLRVGIVGFGWFGHIHLDAWRQVGDVEVSAICDADQRAVQPKLAFAQDGFHVQQGEAARELGDVPFFSNLEAFLADAPCDLIDIVVPEALHADVAAAALEAGKSVIVEKPFTTCAEDARRLLELSEIHDRRVFPANILRFDSRYLHAIGDLLRDQAPPRHISCQRHFQRSALEVYGRVHPFFGACVHDIDLAIWAHGSPPRRAFASVTRSGEDARIEAVAGILKWEDGSTAVIQNAWLVGAGASGGFLFDSTFFGQAQTLTIRNQPIVEVIGDKAVTWPELFFWPTIADRRGGALVEELRHFAECERRGKPSDRVPLDQACWGISAADALVASAECSAWVDVAPL